MDLPNTITHAVEPLNATLDYGSPRQESGGSGDRSRVVQVVGAGISQPVALALQLQKRLRFIAILVAGAVSVRLAIHVALFARTAFALPLAWSPALEYFGELFAVAFVGYWAIYQLAFRQDPGLRRLRFLEFLVFAAVTFFCVNDTQLFIIASHGNFPKFWAGVTNAGALLFVLLIVCYGVLIPNTWNRCFVAVGLIAACGYLAFVLGLVMAPQPAELVVSVFVQLTLWLGIAVAIAVYGAYRIEILRDQAEQGRELGQYRLRRSIGAGGMGKVYLAEHRFLRRPCAIKIISPERAGDPKNLARFEREVQVTATLTHPNTVQVFDYGRADDGTFYYVMEYLPGLTLDELIASHGPLPPARAVHLLRQICGALREAHAVGLIHRDIKPGNVIVCERGGVGDVAKVLDFGLVRTTASQADEANLTQEGTLTGTPAYMSPEQAAAKGDLDARSDIYSVGALAYFLLAGRAPFAGRSGALMIAAHLYEAPAPLATHRADVPADLEAVVLRCLAKDPADRFPDAESLEAALAECGCAGQWTGKDAAAWWRSNGMFKGNISARESARNLV